MGAVLIEAFGGGVEMLAPTPDSGGEGGTLPLIEELVLHSLVTESYAYPSGQVTVGSTVVVGVVNISRLVRAHRIYAITNKRATGQLTYL